MKNKKPLIIFGTGEIGSLAKFYFNHDSNYKVVAYTADDQFIKSDKFENLPLIPFSKINLKYPPNKFSMHVALSYNKLNKIREKKYNDVKKLKYKLASYVCTKSIYWDDLVIGDNCLILENQTIQPTVKIGNNVMIWSGNHIGHGSIIKDHVYISSHVVISGHCVIGKRTFMGVNSAVKDFINIGSDNFITMGSLVISNTNHGSVVLPGKGLVLGGDEVLAKKIINKYFNLN
jgi:sugar O-acyltransferase (sialic acid O-acetyltransferase NeuD family)